MAIDWDGLANKALNTTIDIIARKVGGIQTTGVTVGPAGAGLSLYSPYSGLFNLALIGLAIAGIYYIVKKS